MRAYASAADHLQYHPYLVNASQADQGVKYEEWMHLPMFEPLDPSQRVRTQMTISDMIKIYHRGKTSFAILNEEDVLRIRHEMDAYLQELYDKDIMGQPDVKSFLQKFYPWRERVGILSERVLNRHPKWRDRYPPTKPALMESLISLLAIGQANKDKATQNVDKMLNGPAPIPSLRNEINNAQAKWNSVNIDTARPVDPDQMYGKSGGVR